ncbi:MAG: ATP-binding cassette domain-containing protein, partial [bacterium]
DLRQQISLVSQDVVLFNDSVAGNIAYGGLSGASREEITRAAESAHAMEFISKLPDGLDTIVGENGTLLSGGQRQRIAIARALLKDAPVLILDEATSALDSASERAIQEALDEVMKHRTTIVIAHRLSTIENADQVVVLDEGRVLEQGTHQGLLDQGGAYARLYRIQFGE